MTPLAVALTMTHRSDIPQQKQQPFQRLFLFAPETVAYRLPALKMKGGLGRLNGLPARPAVTYGKTQYRGMGR